MGITIHKSQGLTITNSVVNIDPKDNAAGAVSVTKSRVRKQSDLIMEPSTLE